MGLCDPEELFPVEGQYRLVGGDDILAPFEGGLDPAPGFLDPAHQLHHEVDFLGAADRVRVARDRGRKGLRDLAPTIGASNRDPDDIERAVLCPEFPMTLRQELQESAAHGSQTQDSDPAGGHERLIGPGSSRK